MIDKVTAQGVQNTVVATIQLAVEDVKALTKAGVIKDGILAVARMPCRICDGMTIPEVKDLLNFFKDENLGTMLDVGEIKLAPAIFRKRLGFNW